MDKINKILNFEIKQVGEEQDRVLRFCGSDETPDRDNDIMEINGWKLDDYVKNPVFLWAHQYDQPPIGKAINVTADSITKQLVFDIKFPTYDEYPFADTIYKLYKGGYLQATSVGFQGSKYETRNDEAVNGLPEWQRGRRYKEQKLLELSAVPVPANPNALQMVQGKGFKPEDINKIFEEEKTVIPYKKYPLADEGESWNGPSEIAAASVEDLKLMSAWYDSENAENKGAYKLPHHKQEGYTTVWRAVAAAMGALLGARGGVDIPESDKQGVYNHLAKHYSDFDKEPPEYKSYTDIELKSMFEYEEKSGAAISAKNRAMMEEAMGHMQMAMDMMGEMMGMMPEEEAQHPMEPMKTADMTMRFAEITEIKQALDEIKSQVLSLCEKSVITITPPAKPDASKEINLDAIEITSKSEELNIEPEMLQRFIKESIQDVVNNSIKNTLGN